MKKQSFVVGSAALMLTMTVTKILGLIYKIPLTNLLGGEGMSCYQSAYSVFMPMFSVSVFGICLAVSKLVSENLSFKRFKNALKIKRTALILFSLTGLLFSLLTAVVGYPICIYLLKSREAFYSLIALCPSIFFGSILSVYRGFFEGRQSMTPTCVSEIVESVARVLLGLGGAYLAIYLADKSFLQSGTVFGIACCDKDEEALISAPFVSAFSLLGVTLSTAAATGYLAILSKKKSFRLPSLKNEDKVTDRAKTICSFLISLAVPMALCSVITTLASVADTLTISPSLTSVIKNLGFVPTQWNADGIAKESVPSFIFGSYSGLALTVFGLVPSLTAMIGKSALPEISRLYAKGRLREVRAQSEKTFLLTTLIALPSGLGIALFSKEILSLLFGSRQAEIDVSAGSLTVLGAGVLFISLSVTAFSLLQSIGKPKTPVYILLASLPIKPILNVILIKIPSLGVTGAAISTVVFYMLCAVWGTAAYFKATGLRFSVSRLVLRPICAASNCIFTALIFYNFLSARFNSKLSFLASAVFSVIIYIFCLSLLFNFNKKAPARRFLR